MNRSAVAPHPQSAPQPGPGGHPGPLSVPEFWQLAITSQLMTPQQMGMLQQSFAQTKGAALASASTLVEWLVAGQYLSRFQANLLLARQPGPFVFGPYRVYDKIDSGRLAGVFRAVHVQSNQPVCLQFLTGPAAQDPARVAAVAQQAALFSGLNHPNVLRSYHFADLQAYRVTLFENLHGQSLQEKLAAGPLPPAEACRIARQIALGLMKFEEHKLLHGELRPANVWINHLGTVKVLGFPLYRDPLSGVEPINSATAAQPHGRLSRMADYLAPEIARTSGQGDVRCDVYSLGCILYEMLVGRPPFPEGDPFQKLLAHASGEVVPPDRMNPRVPSAISQVTMYLLAKDPNQRYQQPAHVAEALAPYIDPQGLTVYAEPPTSTSQAYEAWLAQNHPAIEPDPDTGEFHVQVREGDFAHVRGRQAEPPPAFMAPAAGQPMFAPPAGQPQSGQFQFNPAGGAPQSGGFNPAGFQPPQQGFQPPQPGFPQQQPGFQQPGPAAAPAALTPADKARLEEEKFNKKVMTYAYTAGGIVGMIVLGAVIISASSSKPPKAPKDLSAATVESTAKPSASATGGGTAKAVGGGEPYKAPPGVAPPPRAVPTKANPTVIASAGGGGMGGGNEAPAVEGPYSAVWDEVYADKSNLWAYPLPGERVPLDLNYLPTGVQFLLAIRPADMLGHPEGGKAWESLGGWGKSARRELEAMAGAPLEKIELLLVGFLANEGEPNRFCTVAHFKEPIDKKTVLAAWGNPQETPVKGTILYAGGGRAYMIPAAAADKTTVCVPQSMMQDLTLGGPPPMRNELEKLAEKAADQRAHVCFLFSPNYFFTGGKAIFSGGAERLRDPLDVFLKVDQLAYAPGGLALLHLGDDYFYSELRLYSTAEVPGQTLAPNLHKFLDDVPARVFHFYHPSGSSAADLGFIPTDFSRPVLARYPKMLDAWIAYAQHGHEGPVAIVNSVLPLGAAHNLALGTQLALRDPGLNIARPNQTASAAPQTLEEKLKKIKLPLVIPRDAWGRIMIQLTEDYGVDIEIAGGDLELLGITKNQSIGVDIKEPIPLGEVIAAVAAKANPTLVWVISPDKKKVIVTTKAMAFQRGTPDPMFKLEKPK